MDKQENRFNEESRVGRSTVQMLHAEGGIAEGAGNGHISISELKQMMKNGYGMQADGCTPCIAKLTLIPKYFKGISFQQVNQIANEISEELKQQR